jgi:hypothetical protein
MPANPIPKVLRRAEDRLRLIPRQPRRARRPEPPTDWFGDDGTAGVREPRRPKPHPPGLAARALPPAPAELLDLVAV